MKIAIIMADGRVCAIGLWGHSPEVAESTCFEGGFAMFDSF